MNIDRYIRQSVRRELAARRYRDSVSRVRHIDRCAMSVRHSDGLQDIAAKIKEKVSGLISMLQSDPKARKVVKALGTLLTLVGSVFSVKNAVDVKREIHRINESNKQIKEAFEEYSDLSDTLSAEENGSLPLLSKKKAFITGAIKALIGLVTAFTGILMQKFAKNPG